MKNIYSKEDLREELNQFETIFGVRIPTQSSYQLSYSTSGFNSIITSDIFCKIFTNSSEMSFVIKNPYLPLF